MSSPTDQLAGSPGEVGRASDAPPAMGGCGRAAVGLVALVVLGLLGLFGYKLAASSGWLGQGGVAVPGQPGVFTSGQLVRTAFRRAPEFTLRLYSGETLRLADLQGKPVMVNFWASWCPPCREEAPLVERTWRAYREKGVVFVGVNVWDREEDARRFLKEFDVTFPTGPDPGGAISIDYGLTGLPETYFVDREGRVARKWIGPFTEPILRALLDEVVAPAG